MEPLIPLETFSCKTDTKCPAKGTNDADTFPSYLDEAKCVGSEGPVTGNKQRPDGDPTEIVQVAAVTADEIFIGQTIVQTEKVSGQELNSSALFSETNMPTNPAVPFSIEHGAAISPSRTSPLAASALTDEKVPQSAAAGSELAVQQTAVPQTGGKIPYRETRPKLSHPINRPEVVLKPEEDAADTFKWSVSPTHPQLGDELAQPLKGDNLSSLASQGNHASGISTSRFVALLGKTIAPPPEQPLKPISLQQGNTANNTASGTSSATTEKTFLEITKHFLSENNMDEPGANTLQARPTNLAHAIHTSATTDITSENFAAALHLRDASQLTQPNQEGATIRLPSGIEVTDKQIIDQIFEHISIRSLNSSEGTSNLSIRMHPEELGRLELELVANKDGIKAHIHAQTHQVQDILEKHIFRLREGFEQQGLKLQEVTVSVNSEQHHGPGHFHEQPTPHSPSSPLDKVMVRDDFEPIPDEIITPNFHADGGFSLRI